MCTRTTMPSIKPVAGTSETFISKDGVGMHQGIWSGWSLIQQMRDSSRKSWRRWIDEVGWGHKGEPNLFRQDFPRLRMAAIKKSCIACKKYFLENKHTHYLPMGPRIFRGINFDSFWIIFRAPKALPNTSKTPKKKMGFYHFLDCLLDSLQNPPS
jgi:hypothetical protein